MIQLQIQLLRDEIALYQRLIETRKDDGVEAAAVAAILANLTVLQATADGEALGRVIGDHGLTRTAIGKLENTIELYCDGISSYLDGRRIAGPQTRDAIQKAGLLAGQLAEEVDRFLNPVTPVENSPVENKD